MSKFIWKAIIIMIAIAVFFIWVGVKIVHGFQGIKKIPSLQEQRYQQLADYKRI